MAIKDYSTTPSSNLSLFPEGMDPAAVNNGMRQVQADIRSYYNSPEFRDLGNTPTYVSGTSFTIAGDVTASYVVGQRLKLYGTTMGTLYGTIATSSYSSPNTTITVTMDSGSLTSNLSTVSAGINPTSDPIPAAALSGLVAAIDSTVISGKTAVTIASNDYILIGDTSDSNNLKKGLVSDIVPVSATDTAAGIVEKATAAEMKTPTADKYPDAVLVRQHPGTAKAWCVFNGATTGTNPPLAGYGVTSVTRNSTGDYTINLADTYASTDEMCPIASCIDPLRGMTPISSKTTTSIRFETANASDAANFDPTRVHFTLHGTLA